MWWRVYILLLGALVVNFVTGSLLARPLVAESSRLEETIITLNPSWTNATVAVASLPTTNGNGLLFQMHTNYDDFRIGPKRGTQITSVPTTVTSQHNEVLYVAPSSFSYDDFTYTATDGITTSSAGTVAVTKSTRVKVSSNFILNADNWTIEAAGSQSATHSATSVGGLNHYIYASTINLVVGANNELRRWSFASPSKFDGDHHLAFNGLLSFWVGDFAGDFSSSGGLLYEIPRRFVELHCDTCDSGNGRILVQRDVVYTGGIEYFEFTLNTSSPWRIDPKDRRSSAIWSAPTNCEFVEVLSALSSIRIYGDFTSGYEAVGIDEVTITLGDANIPDSCL